MFQLIETHQDTSTQLVLQVRLLPRRTVCSVILANVNYNVKYRRLQLISQNIWLTAAITVKLSS